MFILDDLLLSPLVFIARKIREAAEQETAGQEQAITSRLTELFRLLESGEIEEAECDRQEVALLDQLDEIRHKAQTDDNGGEEASEQELESDRELAAALRENPWT